MGFGSIQFEMRSYLTKIRSFITGNVRLLTYNSGQYQNKKSRSNENLSGFKDNVSV